MPGFNRELMETMSTINPMKIPRQFGILVIIALLTWSGLSAQAQYSLGPSKIAGGGATTPSTGGVYAVSGTIGQPDASGTLAGGPYAVSGGVWPSLIQTPGAPLLSAQSLAGGNVRISWPLSAASFVLDQTVALTNAPATNVWSQVPFPYATNATEISITVPVPAGNKFYRLRKP